MKYKERSFRLKYDNRRKVMDPNDEEDYLLDTKPLEDINKGAELRKLSNIFTKSVYNRQSSKSQRKSCKTVLETAIRSFLKDLLADESLYGLEKHRQDFPEYRDIIKFIKDFGYNSISKTSLSMMKKRKMIRKSVTKTKETIEFTDYVKKRLPGFRVDLFFQDKN